jgi:hypothetical protein
LEGLTGKIRSVDHPSPERDILCNPQNTKAFIWSTRIGLEWSMCPHSYFQDSQILPGTIIWNEDAKQRQEELYFPLNIYRKLDFEEQKLI